MTSRSAGLPLANLECEQNKLRYVCSAQRTQIHSHWGGILQHLGHRSSKSPFWKSPSAATSFEEAAPLLCITLLSYFNHVRLWLGLSEMQNAFPYPNQGKAWFKSWFRTWLTGSDRTHQCPLFLPYKSLEHTQFSSLIGKVETCISYFPTDCSMIQAERFHPPY